jgi:hypothetical protein
MLYRDYGYFGVQAYQEYNNTLFLSTAEFLWGVSNGLTISPDQAVAGRIPTKANSFMSECQGGE